MSNTSSHKADRSPWTSAVATPSGFKVRRTQGAATVPALDPKIQAHIREISTFGTSRAERRDIDKIKKRTKTPQVDLFSLNIEHILAASETSSSKSATTLNPVMDEAVRILRATSTEAMRLTTIVHERMIESGLQVYAALVRPNDLLSFDAILLVNPEEVATQKFETAYDAAEKAEDEAESMHLLMNISFLSVRNPPEIPEDHKRSDKLPESLETLVLDGYVYVRIRQHRTTND